MVLKQDSHLKPDDPTLLRLEAQVAIGASAALAVILNKKLFVAGCGDTRAVLCLQVSELAQRFHGKCSFLKSLAPERSRMLASSQQLES